MSVDITPDAITCPGCGNQIGEEVVIEDVVLIHAGGGVWRELRGYCAQCGKPFYWTASDRQMQQVISVLTITRARRQGKGE